MENKLYIIGVGPGNEKYLLPCAKEAILSADVILGGKRNLDSFKHLKKDDIVVGGDLNEAASYIKENINIKKIALLVSGDTGIYSMLGIIKRNLPNIDLEIIPGISSMQYFASKLSMEWADMKISSVHGREEENLLNILASNPKTFLFTGGKSSPASICKSMLDAGIKNAKVFVGENLTYENERIIDGSPEEISHMDFEPLSVMVVENDIDKIWNYSTAGIPDELFIRGNVPMTKEEIRALSISKLRLTGSNTVVDIGAGTGSIAVECGLFSQKGKVYAVEKEAEAVALIEENSKKFQAYNIKIIHGIAPEILDEIPKADRVFIGGSAGKMADILAWAGKSKVRIVINAVTIESAYEAISELDKQGFEDVEIINVSISKGRKLGGKHLMQALNPIYIISAEKK